MARQFIPWTIEVRALATALRGVPGRPQAATVDISVQGLAPAYPHTIADCIDYQPICEHVLGAWSDAACGSHPEQAVRALIAFVLALDGRIGQVDVALATGGATLRLSQARMREDARLVA